MGASLVGTIAVPSITGASPATPVWGTGMTRAAGNLLIVWWNNQGNENIPATPSGWSSAVSATSSGSAFNSSGIFYKVATGGDAAPALTDNRLYVAAAEFTGDATTTALDQTGLASSLTSSPYVATAGGTDIQTGELVVFVGSAHYSVAPPGNQFTTAAFNNGTAVLAGLGNTAADQAGFGYAVTTANASADSISFTVNTASSLLGGCASIASFTVSPATSIAMVI